NLCRCTGYAGIVRAILKVLAEGGDAPRAAAKPLPVLPPVEAPPPQAISHPTGATQFEHAFRLPLPVATVWEALHDRKLVAECIPGVRVIEMNGDRVRGEIRATLGPIGTHFTGEGVVSFDDVGRSANVSGRGRDRRTGTHLDAHATIRLEDVDPVA